MNLIVLDTEKVPTAPLNFIRGRRKRADAAVPRAPKPEWLKVRAPGSENYLRLKGLMRELGLHTVCEEANCPNIGECWHHGTATFMILGDTCTRSCGYCNVSHGLPKPPVSAEPAKVGSAVHTLELDYVVVTSVDRDDLPDGGAAHFAHTIREIRERTPACRIEVLIPDFKGEAAPLRTVLDAAPDVLNHNIETVSRLYRTTRPGGRYDRALQLLDRSRSVRPGHSDEVGPDGRPRRGMGRDPRDAPRPALRRMPHRDHRPVPQAVVGERADVAVLHAR